MKISKTGGATTQQLIPSLDNCLTHESHKSAMMKKTSNMLQSFLDMIYA